MCYDVLRTFTDAKPYAKCCEIFHTWSIWLTEIPNIYICMYVYVYIYIYVLWRCFGENYFLVVEMVIWMMVASCYYVNMNKGLGKCTRN